jgi:hypothetical protein
MKSPAKWLVAYVMLAPVFATVYAGLPTRSFHDTNIELEAPVREDGQRLAESLSEEARARINGTRWPSARSELEFNPGSITLELRHTHDGRLLVRVEGNYASVPAHNQVVVAGAFVQWFRLDIESPGELVIRGRVAATTYPLEPTNPEGTPKRIEVDYTFPERRPPFSLVFPPPPGALPAHLSDQASLVLGNQNAKRLVGFFYAVEGDPHYASGLWARMLYFSATTITTLGLGDVTPVSSLARLLVGLEALVGIVFIGLFLNGLADSFRKRRLTTKSDASGQAS